MIDERQGRIDDVARPTCRQRRNHSALLSECGFVFRTLLPFDAILASTGASTAGIGFRAAETLIEKIVVCAEPNRPYTGGEAEVADLADFEACFCNVEPGQPTMDGGSAKPLADIPGVMSNCSKGSR